MVSVARSPGSGRNAHSVPSALCVSADGLSDVSRFSPVASKFVFSVFFFFFMIKKCIYK